jgi:hypothetical protein
MDAKPRWTWRSGWERRMDEGPEINRGVKGKDDETMGIIRASALGSIHAAQNLVGKYEAGDTEVAKRLVREPVTDLRLGAVEAVKELVGPNLPEGYRKVLEGKLLEVVTSVREEVAKGEGKKPEEVKLNLVTLMNVAGLIEKTLKLPEPQYEIKESMRIKYMTKLFGWSEMQLEWADVKSNADEVNTLKQKIAKSGQMTRLSGERELEGADELLKKEWEMCMFEVPEGGKVKVYFPKGTFPSREEMVKQMKGLVWVDRDARSRVGPIGYVNGETDVVLTGDKKYFSRAFCRDNWAFLTDLKEGLETPFHEKVHEEFYRRYGMSGVGAVLEGAAVYFTNQEFPGGQVNAPDRLFRIENVLETVTKAQEGEGLLTHMDIGNRYDAGHPEVTDEYKYAYGVLLVAFIMEKYGQEKFMKIYQATAAKNPIGASEAKVAGARTEAEVLSKSIELAGIELGEFKKGLVEYAKKWRGY